MFSGQAPANEYLYPNTDAELVEASASVSSKGLIKDDFHQKSINFQPMNKVMQDTI